MMGYTDVSVIWEGALDSEQSFTDEQSDAMEAFINAAKADAIASDDSVEIYTLYHDHDMSEDDCVCVQYLTDHSPDWTNYES